MIRDDRESLKKIIRFLISEESSDSIVTLRTPGASHSSYAASHPIKKRSRRPNLGYERGEVPQEEIDEPVKVSRRFSERA